MREHCQLCGKDALALDMENVISDIFLFNTIRCGFCKDSYVCKKCQREYAVLDIEAYHEKVSHTQVSLV